MRIFGLSDAQWLDIANQVRLWAAAIAGVAAVAAFISSWAQLNLQKAVGREKDSVLEQYKANASVRTASLERMTVDARLEQARLENDNLRLQHEIENERAARLKIEHAIGPRTLSQRSVDALRAKLATSPTPIIISLQIDPNGEAAEFGNQLGEALVPAVHRVDALSVNNAMPSASNSGITVVGFADEVTNVMQAAFRDAAIEAAFVTRPPKPDWALAGPEEDDVNVIVFVLPKPAHASLT